MATPLSLPPRPALVELERLKPFKPAVVDNKVTTTSTTLPACRNIQDLRSAIKKMTNLNLPKSTSHHDDLRKRFINFLDNIFKLDRWRHLSPSLVCSTFIICHISLDCHPSLLCHLSLLHLYIILDYLN